MASWFSNLDALAAISTTISLSTPLAKTCNDMDKVKILWSKCRLCFTIGEKRKEEIINRKAIWMGQELCYFLCWIGIGAGREFISIVSILPQTPSIVCLDACLLECWITQSNFQKYEILLWCYLLYSLLCHADFKQHKRDQEDNLNHIFIYWKLV